MQRLALATPAREACAFLHAQHVDPISPERLAAGREVLHVVAS
jgi:hypothetical protein